MLFVVQISLSHTEVTFGQSEINREALITITWVFDYIFIKNEIFADRPCIMREEGNKGSSRYMNSMDEESKRILVEKYMALEQEKYASFAIHFERDDEAGVWIAVSGKIGLVMEDDSLRGLLIRIATALPDLMG